MMFRLKGFCGDQIGELMNGREELCDELVRLWFLGVWDNLIRIFTVELLKTVAFFENTWKIVDKD